MKLESQLAFTIYNYNTTPEPASRLQIYKQNIRELFYRYNWSNTITIIERIQDRDTQQPSTSTSIVFLWEELTLTIPVVVVIPSLKTGNENEKYWGINQSHSRCVKLGIPNTLPVILQSEIEHNKKSWHSQRSYRQTVKGQARMWLPKGEKHWLSRRRYSIKIKIIYLSKNSCLFQLPSHFGLPRFRKNDDISVCFTYTGKSWVQYPILQSILSWHKKQRSIFSVPFFQLVHIEKITSKDKNSNWRYWKKSWELLLLFKVKLRK